MALSNLVGWTKKMEEAPAGSCGTACGAGDKSGEEQAPTACGTACGAGDQ